MKPKTHITLTVQQPLSVALPWIQDEDAVIKAALDILHRRLDRSADVLSSPATSRNYLTLLLAQEERENFVVIFLDTQNRVIATETLALGTLSECAVYPREIVMRGLLLEASALVMVHNHPSGDTTPSRADIDMTRDVSKACATVGITLHDHLIVGRAGHASLRALGLL